MVTEWKSVYSTSTGQEYVEPKVLSSGMRSSCRAVFFRNVHRSNGTPIVSLKIARLDKNGKAKEGKSITLRQEEIDLLIEYIQEYYTPLNIGLTEFIEADEDAAELFKKVRDLGISDEEVASKLIESGILTENMSVAITAAERNNAVHDFEVSLDQEPTESFWQDWFSRNKWILGSDYLNILPERDIDAHDIADYLMRSIDGFVDVVEIKRPDLPFWAGPDSHGNYYPTSHLTAAIAQCLNYLYRIELQSNSVEFMERVGGAKTVKPQCLLVYGRSDDWGEDKMKAMRILNAAYHQLHIMTYDQLLARAKQLLGIPDCEDNYLPF